MDWAHQAQQRGHMRIIAIVVLLATIVSCATNKSYMPRQHPDHEIISEKHVDELSFSLNEYYEFQKRNKIQFFGNGISVLGVYNFTEGMTLSNAIDLAGGTVDCATDNLSILVKRATPKRLYIIQMPLSGQLWTGDSMFVNCFQ